MPVLGMGNSQIIGNYRCGYRLCNANHHITVMCNPCLTNSNNLHAKDCRFIEPVQGLLQLTDQCILSLHLDDTLYIFLNWNKHCEIIFINSLDPDEIWITRHPTWIQTVWHSDHISTFMLIHRVCWGKLVCVHHTWNLSLCI